MKRFLALTMVAAGISASAIGGATAQEKAANKTRTPLSPPVQVVLGTIGSASDVGFFIAQERGYFRDEGLDVKFEFVGSAAKMVPALATGEIQVASGGINAGLVNAVDRGIALRIVADKGTLTPGSGYQSFLVRKELASKIRTARDVKGLKIATSGAPHTVDAIVVGRLLKQAGLTDKDVTIVDLQFPNMVSALASGAVDMALIIEPFATRAIDQGTAVRWKGADEFAPNFQLAGVFYGPTFAKEQPEAARRFMLAYVRAIRDYNDEFLSGKNPDPIISVLTKYTRIKDPNTYKRMIPPSISANAEVKTESIKQAMAVWKGHRLIPESDPAKIVDQQYLRYAWEQLGKK